MPLETDPSASSTKGPPRSASRGNGGPTTLRSGEAEWPADPPADSGSAGGSKSVFLDPSRSLGSEMVGCPHKWGHETPPVIASGFLVWAIVAVPARFGRTGDGRWSIVPGCD